MALPQNFSSWEFTQKIIRIGHNRDVTAHFRDIIGDEQRDTGRAAVKTALLIRDEDSALEVLNKQLYFRLGVAGDSRQAIATVPEWWPLRVGAERPQLVVAFRAPGQKTTYTLTIPHYTGNRNPAIPAYHKGSWRGELTLGDNSKLVVNARTDAEAARVLGMLQRYVKPSLLKDHTPKFTRVKKGFNEVRVAPIFADFYSRGQTNTQPDWRSYF